MTYQELQDLLETSGIPFAGVCWEAPVPAPPYGVYLDTRTENFAADDRVYLVVKRFRVELYLAQRSEAVEGALEAVLDGAELFWDKDAVYVDELALYQVSYEIEV